MQHIGIVAMRRSSRALAVVLLCGMGLLEAAAWGATVRFQNRTYEVRVVKLATDVPMSASSDLIFVGDRDNKLLALPTSGAARGDFDAGDPESTGFTGKRNYYMLTGGNITAYASIDAAIIAVDGILYNRTTEILASPAETIVRPVTIPLVNHGVDICILNERLLGYRTEGSTTEDEFVYPITRVQASVVEGQSTLVGLHSDDWGSPNPRVFVEYDFKTRNYLLAQFSLDPTTNTDARDRLVAVAPDGTQGGVLLLNENPDLPEYQGGAVGIAVDPFTGTIYLLDATARQIFIFDPPKPELTGISPAGGSALGGTKVTITGVNLPADVAVSFGDAAASDVNLSGGGTTITAVTPAHAAGVVDVTVTGTGLTPALVLAGGFAFGNAPPEAHLAASPSQGLPPLTVSFSTAHSTDSDGTLAYREIDFGDSSSFVFPADLSIVETTHTYTAMGTYMAKLTVRDDQGGQGDDTVVIIVGEGADLVLRALSFKTGGSGSAGRAKDTMKLKGEIILPDVAALADAKLTVGFVDPAGGGLGQNAEPGTFQEIREPAAAGEETIGGRFCGWLNSQHKVSTYTMRFGIKALKKPGFLSNTYAISFSGYGDQSSPLGAALEGAVVNLTRHEDGTPLSAAEQAAKRVGKVMAIVRFEMATGDILQYRKLATVDIRPGRNTSVKLTRP